MGQSQPQISQQTLRPGVEDEERWLGRCSLEGSLEEANIGLHLPLCPLLGSFRAKDTVGIQYKIILCSFIINVPPCLALKAERNMKIHMSGPHRLMIFPIIGLKNKFSDTLYLKIFLFPL